MEDYVKGFDSNKDGRLDSSERAMMDYSIKEQSKMRGSKQKRMRTANNDSKKNYKYSCGIIIGAILLIVYSLIESDSLLSIAGMCFFIVGVIYAVIYKDDSRDDCFGEDES